jgi:ketosteroid isomerase-like protein
MSQENLELVRRCVEAWSTGDREKLAGYLHPDVVFHSAITNIVGETVAGREAILGLLDRWAEEWSTLRWEVDEYIDAGEGRVVTLHRVIAKGRASGIELDRELGGVWDIQEGLIIREWIYLDRDEALEAAGLRE